MVRVDTRQVFARLLLYGYMPSDGSGHRGKPRGQDEMGRTEDAIYSTLIGYVDTPIDAAMYCTPVHITQVPRTKNFAI